jgi:hypothetical protein
MGWTIEKVADALCWPGFNGWSGECCGKCHTTINMLGCGSGYFCKKCGHYNCVSFSHCRLTNKHPDYGPPKALIREGFDLAKQRAEAARKFDVGDRVFVNGRSGIMYPYGPKNDQLGTVIARNNEFGLPAPGCQAYEIEFDDDSPTRYFWEHNLTLAQPRAAA